jgi:acid phosphatase family membrane protein YuiD
MATDLNALWSNHTLWIPISAMILVQLAKFLGEGVIRHDFDLQVLFRTGGMPSSHSALVTSLATATAILDGLGSSSFAIATVLALIVMYDARGVRQESGKQARILNQVVRELFRGQPISEQELKELLGHTAFEVGVGAAIGIMYTLILLALLTPAL